MPRRTRIEFAGAAYHVLDRGDRREAIFRDDRDRETFLATLGAACARTGWRVHAYVLMGNHYHLLLETPQANLAKGMHWLQCTYTARFNRRRRLVGHLFQGRSKAVVVDPQERSYFAALSDYIHLNPVRARMLGGGRLADFRWSSYPAYVGLFPQRPAWLVVAAVLGELGLEDRAGQRRLYSERMQRRAEEDGSRKPGWWRNCSVGGVWVERTSASACSGWWRRRRTESAGAKRWMPGWLTTMVKRQPAKC